MTDAEGELYSLLVPLYQERLLLPRACVAEVIRYFRPESQPGDPPWLRGRIRWNGRQIPVVSFEALAGLGEGEPGGRTRIAVLNPVSGSQEAGHYGLLTEGFPQLVRVNRNVIQPDDREAWSAQGPVLCQVRMINEHPLIPDLDVLESLIREALGTGSEPVLS
jgi:chemosensory pili system protein ChpC